MVVHRWAHRTSPDDPWETTDRIAYPLEGGREGGYRGFTLKRNVAPGQWRVSVETEQGAVLGRIRFDLVESEADPESIRTRFY